MIHMINIALMVGCMIVLVWFLLATRRFDDTLWWGLRFLLIHSLISVIYMTHDAIDQGYQLSLNLVLIRWGFVSLVVSLALLWHLLRRQSKHFKEERFKDRLADLFKKDTP